jgi:hypothetical protein
MKNLKSYLYIACLIFIFTGCTKKYVDLEAPDKLSPDVIYSTLDGIEGSLTGIFSQARLYCTWEEGCEYKFTSTDIATVGTNMVDNANANKVYTFTSFDSQNSFIKTVWEAYYSGLHKCNLTLSSLDNLAINENVASDVARRDAVIGVVYFFRAYFHLQLVQRWDNIVLADHLFSNPKEVIKLASKEDVYNLITDDLLKAIPLLPEASSYMNERGHITKGVARMLLSKAYMDINEWAKAAEMADAVTKDPAYELVPLDQVFSVAHQDNKEIILSWQFIKGEATYSTERICTRWEPLYDRVQGVKRSFKNGGRPYARLTPTEYYWSLFDKSDKRLNAWHTLYYVYDTSNATDEALPPGVALGDTVKADNFKTVNGYGPEAFTPTTNKWYEDGSRGRAIGDADGYRNIIQFRLAEAYMIAAEAYYRSGNISAGLPFINALRNRAGVAEFTTITDDIILDEQARELGEEGNRFEMLKRLGILHDRVVRYNESGISMQPFHVRWPIPYGFQHLTKVLQNEGYY